MEKNQISNRERGITQKEKGTDQETTDAWIAVPSNSYRKKRNNTLCPINISASLNTDGVHRVEDYDFKSFYENKNDPLFMKGTANYFFPETDKKIHIVTIYFEKDISDLDNYAKGMIKAISSFVPGEISIHVYGYASMDGSKEYNRILSTERAKNVSECLDSYPHKEGLKIYYKGFGRTGERDEKGKLKKFDEYTASRYRKAEIHLLLSKQRVEKNFKTTCKAESKENELNRLQDIIKKGEIPEAEMPDIYKKIMKKDQDKFSTAYKNDASRIFNILCNIDSFNNFAKSMASEFQTSIATQQRDIKKNINTIGLWKYYIQLRKIVLTFTRPYDSGTIGAYQDVPKPFKILWKDYEQFMLPFKWLK